MSKDSLYDLELFISKFLRMGVLIAGLLLLVGWLSKFQFDGNRLAEFEVYRHMSFAESFWHCWAEGQWGLVVSYIGLCVLICLPLIRVLLTAVLFFKHKEHIMASAAAIVFFALLLSFSLGFGV